MRKIVLFSFDDGTVHDGRLAALLRRYGIRGTFNLNSGLEDFVWHFEGRPVQRLRLAESTHIYREHEIASHTAHHPCLTELSDQDLENELRQDCMALKQHFGVSSLGFAVPFTACGEREIRIIRPWVRYIRLSEYRDDFALPPDPYHIRINALYHDADLKEKLLRFSQSRLEVSVFVLCGHAYELEMLDHWDYMEQLLQYLRSFEDFEFMTTMEFVSSFL